MKCEMKAVETEVQIMASENFGTLKFNKEFGIGEIKLPKNETVEVFNLFKKCNSKKEAKLFKITIETI